MTGGLSQAALGHAARGWSIFPCWPRAKAPMTPNGCLSATSDALQVAAWWEGEPFANIGVHAGRSGLAVADADTPEACAWLNRSLSR